MYSSLHSRPDHNQAHQEGQKKQNPSHNPDSNVDLKPGRSLRRFLGCQKRIQRFPRLIPADEVTDDRRGGGRLADVHGDDVGDGAAVPGVVYGHHRVVEHLVGPWDADRGRLGLSPWQGLRRERGVHEDAGGGEGGRGGEGGAARVAADLVGRGWKDNLDGLIFTF